MKKKRIDIEKVYYRLTFIDGNETKTLGRFPKLKTANFSVRKVQAAIVAEVGKRYPDDAKEADSLRTFTALSKYATGPVDYISGFAINGNRNGWKVYLRPFGLTEGDAILPSATLGKGRHTVTSTFVSSDCAQIVFHEMDRDGKRFDCAPRVAIKFDDKESIRRAIESLEKMYKTMEEVIDVENNKDTERPK